MKIILILVSLLIFITEAMADKVCLKSTIKRSKITNLRRVVPSTSRCPTGYQEIINTATLSGAPGSNGTNGTDGSIKVWGDGSDGDLVVTNSMRIDGRKQYGNISIPQGVSALISSGTTIRCTGSITISGRLDISAGSSGQSVPSVTGNTFFPIFNLNQASKTLLNSLPSFPEIVSGSAAARGGKAAVTPSDLTYSLHNVRKVDNTISGVAGTGSLDSTAGSGGGSVAIYCKSGISLTNTGELHADGFEGTNGAGGGSGGIIVLASNSAINNQGIITAKGAYGTLATTVAAEGGSGSGGLIHFISPSITQGTTNVLPGEMATLSSPPGTVTSGFRSGGGAGGSCAGTGGDGGNVNADGSTTGVTAGSAGVVLSTVTTSSDVSPLIM